MSITIGGIEFARAHYDPRGDVLYLTVAGYEGPPYVGHASEEGHGVEFAETGRVIAMIIVSARRWLERDGELRITLPVEYLTPQELAGLGGSAALSASEAELAPALQSAA
jgi:uncharacterized protein YuzE